MFIGTLLIILVVVELVEIFTDKNITVFMKEQPAKKETPNVIILGVGRSSVAGTDEYNKKYMGF